MQHVRSWGRLLFEPQFSFHTVQVSPPLLYWLPPPPNDLHTETMCSAAITKRFNLSLPPPVLGYFYVERWWTYPRYRDLFLEEPRSSSSLSTLCIPMRRTLYQKMAIRTSSNFRQRTANGEVHRHHPWLDLRSIPTNNSPHHHNTRRDTGDRQTNHSDSFFSFRSCRLCQTELLWATQEDFTWW